MTIEDATGFANLVIFEKLFEQYRKEILQSRLVMVEGKLQVEGEVIHVIVQRCFNFSKLLRHLTSTHDDELPLLTLSRADEKNTLFTTHHSQPLQTLRLRFISFDKTYGIATAGRTKLCKL